MSADTTSRNPMNKLGGTPATSFEETATFSQRTRAWFGSLAVVILAAAPCAHADVVTDSNAKAAEIASKIPSTPIAVRTMAIVQVSVFEAANAVTAARSWKSNSAEEDLVLRAKSMNRDASMGTGG